MRNHLKEAIEFGLDLVTDDWRDREIESNEFDSIDMVEDELNTMQEEGDEEDDNMVDTSFNYCQCFCQHDVLPQVNKFILEFIETNTVCECS